MSDRHEARLLLAILAERWDAAAALARRRAANPEILVSLARSCDVHPQMHAVLERAGRFDLVGGDARNRLAALRAKCRSDNLLLLARLEQALDLLLAAGVVPVALKGADVLHRFSLRFDERTLDDVDLLVHPRDFAACLDALLAAGWSAPQEPERTHWLRSSYEMPLASPGPVPVAFEIHWGLGQPRRYDIDVEGLLQRAVPLAVAGRGVRRLDSHDAVAHLLLHHLQHYFDRRLKWALDLGRISREPGFDWGTVARRLGSWGGSAAAGLSLAHLTRLFPGMLPPEAVRHLPASPWRKAVTAPLRSSHPLDLFRGTRRRWVQLWIAAAGLERPLDLPGYLLHRRVRDRRTEGSSPEAWMKPPREDGTRTGGSR